MRRPPGGTFCIGIRRAAIGRPYNARQPLFLFPFPFSLFPFPWAKPDPHQSSSRVRLRVNRGGTAVSVTLMASLVRRVTVSPSSAVNTAWAV